MANDVNNCWAKLDKTAGSGNETLHVYFDENNTGANRSVKIRAYDKTGEAVSEYTLVQLPKEATIYYNTEQTDSFQRTNCPSGYVGTYVEYTIPAGTYSSTVSVEDANRKAREALALEGPAYANVYGECNQSVWKNQKMTKQYQKTGCDPDTEEGSMVDFTVEAGRFTSTVSQADADKQAEEYLDANGPAYASEHGECITVKWYNEPQSKQYQRTDCDPDTEEGAFVTFSVEAGRFSSNISQKDANDKAIAYLDANGPQYANENGECTTVKWYNDAQSGRFQRTDCLSTETGSFVDYTVEAGRFSSTVSKEDANDQAKEALAIEGPEYANEHGTCEESTWYNEEQRETFYKEGCPAGQIGAPYEYVVEAGKYSSTVSQKDANDKALQEIEDNGQATANLEGECVQDPNYFIGKASARVQKNDCDPETQNGSWVDLTEKDLPGYPDAYVSHSSQPEADALAEAAMELHKQELANEKGTCIDKDSWVGTCEPLPTQKNDCTDGMSGTIVEVTVEMCEGYPEDFTSTVSEEDANTKACQLLAERAQAVANAEGSCNDCFPVVEKTFYKTDCPSCQEDLTGMLVSVEDVGGPFCAPDYDAETAQTTYDTLAQAYANKNIETCQAKPVDPDWQNVEPAEFECQEGKSMQKQQDMNECSGTYQEFRWVEGGDLTCSWVGTCEGIDKQKDDCEEGKRGTTVHVTVDMCEGYPEDFTSFEGQTEANELACQLLNERAQAVANAQGSCDDCFTIEEKTFYKNDCPNCTEDLVGMFVTEDLVGGPFCSPDYSSENAQSSYEELAQAYVNKNMASESCTPKSTTPVWEDVSPAEYECQSGQSMKKQVDTNECSDSYNTNQWVPGGDLTCQWTAPDSSQQYTRTCDGTGVGGTVTVESSELDGYPFVSYESPEDAERMRDEAFAAQGEAIASGKPGWTCTWTSEWTNQQITRTDCDECDKSTEYTVTIESIGGPFTSNVSQADANQQAQTAFNEQKDALASKNCQCVNDPAKDSPNWTNTSTTRCSNCSSEVMQRDTNPCSSSYNDTRYVSGGSRDCSESGSWGSKDYSSGYCGGSGNCTWIEPYTQTNSCGGTRSGSDDTPNYAGCGSCTGKYWGEDIGEDDCDGQYSKYYCRNSCSGDYEYDGRELRDGKCGYSANKCYLVRLGTNNTTTDYTAKGMGNIAILPRATYWSTLSPSEPSSESYFRDYCNPVTVSSNQSWCSPISSSISCSGRADNISVGLTVAENTSSSSRTATITVRNSCGESDTFTVTQEGKPNYVFNFGSGSTTSSFNPPRTGSKNDFNITSSKNGVFQEFTASNPISSWAPHTFGSTSGSSRAMSVTASANPDFETRSGTITFTQNESGKTITMNVSQPGFNRHCQVNIEEVRRGSSSSQFIADFTFDMSQGDTPNACWSSCVDYDIMFTVTGGTISNAYSSKTDSMGSTNTTITPGSSNKVAHCTGSYCGGKVYVTLYIDLHSGYDMNRVHIALDRTDTGNSNCTCDLNHTVG